MRFRYWWIFCLVGASGLLAEGEFLRQAEAQDEATPEATAEASTGAERDEGDAASEGAAASPETPRRNQFGGGGDELPENLERFRSKEASFKGKIVVVPVKEDNLMIGARFTFMQRILERAEEEGATAVILDMDTPGGQAWESGKLIMNYLPKMTVPTYTYVNSNAASAGAIIAIGTKTIYMANPSAMGAALAVPATGGDLGETMEKKLDSYMKAQVRSVAKVQGHNPDIAQGFVDDAFEVIIELEGEDREKDPLGILVLSKKGEVLSLDHEEATQIVNGKPLLAKGIATSLEDLISQEGLKGEMVIAEPLGFESFAVWVTRLSFLFIMLGIAGAYMEMQTPGFGIPGAVSVISFAIFFFGYYLAGKLAGFETVAVFMLGLVLVAAEILLFPGTLVLGISGAIMILGALLYTMAGSSPLEGAGAFSLNLDGLSTAMMNLALGLAGSIILVAVLLKYLPETRAMSWLILKTSIAEGPSLDMGKGGPDEKADANDLVGREGVAITALRPSGKGRFGNETLDIVTESEFVESGARVRIVAHQGSRILVEEV